MTDKLLQMFPPEGVKIVTTLFLCFLIGLEREEHRASFQDDRRYSFGGVRAFPLIGLIGYAMALISGPQLLPLTVGFAVIGAFLWLSYQHKLETSKEPGVTTELSGLATYVVGALVSRDQFWIATTLAILSMLLLELKDFLENLATKIPGEEIFTFTKFLLLTCVILPIVPNQGYTSFDLNPFKTWLIVVAISGVSYGSYLLEKVSKGKGGVRLAAVLGGAYSSTFTTFVMAKRARTLKTPHGYSGGILMASGIMYFRFLVLVGLFNGALFHQILAPFLVLGAIGVAGGWAWSELPDAAAEESPATYLTKNPLELASAFSLAVVFAIHDRCHELRGAAPRPAGNLRPGGDHGPRPGGPVHHGTHADGGEDDAVGAGRGRRCRRRRQQQFRESIYRSGACRPENGAAKPSAAARADRAGPAASAVDRAVGARHGR